jgi:uridine kinase
VVEVALAGYDRRARAPLPARETLRIEPDDVVVIEGVPALALDALDAAAKLRIQVECDEGERRRRFEREYRWRGLDADGIARLYDARESDEHPVIRSFEGRADVVLREPQP